MPAQDCLRKFADAAANVNFSGKPSYVSVEVLQDYDEDDAAPALASASARFRSVSRDW